MSPQFMRHFKGVTTRLGDEIELLAIDIFDCEAVAQMEKVSGHVLPFGYGFGDCMQPIEGRSKRIGTSAQALIRNASLDDCVLGVDDFPVPALAVRQEAIGGLVGQCARSDSGGSATGLSATDAWLKAAVGDEEQRTRVEASSEGQDQYALHSVGNPTQA